MGAILVTGGAGFVGHVVVEKLRQRGCAMDNIFVPRRDKHDLTHEDAVKRLPIWLLIPT